MCDGMQQPHEDDAVLAIPDLRDLPVDVVLNADNSALGNTLQRLVTEMVGPDESYAAHGSSML